MSALWFSLCFQTQSLLLEQKNVFPLGKMREIRVPFLLLILAQSQFYQPQCLAQVDPLLRVHHVWSLLPDEQPLCPPCLGLPGSPAQ